MISFGGKWVAVFGVELRVLRGLVGGSGGDEGVESEKGRGRGKGGWLIGRCRL